ncbi:MAG: hypothetical protein HC772_19210 [Leptolyngbyaceae cyanobacterium CRU_2_3]|nr:hypothetical protein [Leptolyngbyaceae cyanobacterium CRU_2_3]
MAEEFIYGSDFDPPPIAPSRPHRESVKIILIGSDRGIAHIIHWLHHHRFIEAGAWSRPQVVLNSDRSELMSITHKSLWLD